MASDYSSPARVSLARIVLTLCSILHIATADPQQLTNNAPFSGAVYLYYPNGQTVSNSQSACPGSAPVSCSGIGQYNWCCPSSFTCVTPPNSNGLVGCCPQGQTCNGQAAPSPVSTVTVAVAAAYTPPPAPVTTVVQPNAYTQPAPAPVYNGYCSTLIANGPGLPTTRAGACGTILVVNEAADRQVVSAWSLWLLIGVIAFAGRLRGAWNGW